jgi:hypothetical protein
MENFGELSTPQNAQKSKILANQAHFTGPEKYRNTKTGRVNDKINESKNDVFGLGLSMLEIGNAKTIKDIYNADGSINVQTLESHKQEFAAKHQANNNLLVSTVHSMVEMNEKDRPDFIEIQDQLPPYQEVKMYLKQREPFNQDVAFDPIAERKVNGIEAQPTIAYNNTQNSPSRPVNNVTSNTITNNTNFIGRPAATTGNSNN